MTNERIASRYAKSLLDLAQSEGKADTVAGDVDTMAAALEESPELSRTLKSPIVKPSMKRKIIDEIFSGKVDPMTLEFFNLCINKGRADIMESILTSFQKQYKTYQGISEVTVHSAVKMSPELLDEIRKKLENSGRVLNKVEFREVIDPSLIGGFVLDLGDNRYDASVAGRINQVKQKFK